MKLPVFRAAAAVSAAAFLLSACSAGLQSNSGGAIPSRAATSHRLHLTGSEHVLYVAARGEIQVYKYGTWQYLGAITDGVYEATALWVDAQKNVYVANGVQGNVTEYDPSGNLIYTYNVGGSSVTGVTTDRHGNVYAFASGSSSASGVVVEFPQQSNTPVAQCQARQGWGIAVNRRGDVFTDAATAYGNLDLEFYPGGLKKYYCGYIVEPVSLNGLGMTFDRQGNLLVGLNNEFEPVDILAPPFRSVTGTIGPTYGLMVYGVSVNKAGTRLYIADQLFDAVFILSYPDGSIIKQLQASGNVYAAVDSNNYVP